MNKLLYLTVSIFLLTIFKCCNMKVDKFKPEIYFSHTDYSEITMAKAIYYENKKKVKEYIQSGRIDINKPGASGFTYLLYAIFLERYDIVRVLLELGADPNQLSVVKHPDGSIEKLTPLVCVCRNHWYSIKYIKLLVEKGANVNDTIVSPPLVTCIMNSGKDQKKVRYLIENGANINQVFGDYTPMQHAVLGGRLDLVDLLWSYGANPLYIGKRGNSLAYMVQKIVNKNLGTPEYVNHAREIMERLKDLGVQFPVSLKPAKNVEEKNDSSITEPNQNKTDDNKVE